MTGDPYYRPLLSRVHHLGFGFHADLCAPGVLKRLEPVRGEVVLELGCGSGLLTRHLVDAGHRVVATDASEAMLELARQYVPDMEDVRRIVLPDDPLPPAAAIVSVGHCLNYLPDEASIFRAVDAIADALLPGGLLAVDLCDLEWAARRQGAPNDGRVAEDWAIVTRYEIPAPDRFVRLITAFTRADDGTWQRDDERHENVLVDTASVPARFAARGVEAEVRPAFGQEHLPAGLRAIVGRKR